jgi:hypothetical protein
VGRHAREKNGKLIHAAHAKATQAIEQHIAPGYEAVVLSSPISFPEHARSQVKGGRSSGEIELIQACDWLTTDSTLDFQREF